MNYVRNASSCLQDISAEERMVYLFRAYITPIIVFFGVPTNILVIIAFSCMQKKASCRFNLYVITIAISYNTELIFNAFLDDFVGRGLYWLSDCHLRVKLDTYGQIACKMITFIPDMASLVSNNILVLFSFDRVLTIYKPFYFSGNHFVRHAIGGILLIYLLGIFLSLPQAFKYSLFKMHCHLKDSQSFWAQYSVYLQIYGTAILPLILVVITNILIFFKLRNVIQERSQLDKNPRKAKAELHRIIGHLTITSIYLFIMLPNVVAIMLRQYSERKGYRQSDPDYHIWTVSLTRLFSSFESFICVTEFPTFCVFLPSFRAELCRLYSCCRPRGNRSGDLTSSRSSP